MKTNIRRGVFETNSSSVHSFGYTETYDDQDKKDFVGFLEERAKDGKIVGEFLELGWDNEGFSGTAMIDVLLTDIARGMELEDVDTELLKKDETRQEEIDKIERNKKLFEANEFFIVLKEVVKELSDLELVLPDADEMYRWHPYGYIDHQSEGEIELHACEETVKCILLKGWYETGNDNG